MENYGKLPPQAIEIEKALEHSKITFENMLKQWHNLSDKQRKEIQSNIDYLNEQLTIPAVSNLLCGSFDPDNSTSSATKCKCGREKWEHLNR